MRDPGPLRAAALLVVARHVQLAPVEGDGGDGEVDDHDEHDVPAEPALEVHKGAEEGSGERERGDDGERAHRTNVAAGEGGRPAIPRRLAATYSAYAFCGFAQVVVGFRDWRQTANASTRSLLRPV